VEIDCPITLVVGNNNDGIGDDFEDDEWDDFSDDEVSLTSDEEVEN
jgi:hypothetical protein